MMRLPFLFLLLTIPPLIPSQDGVSHQTIEVQGWTVHLGPGLVADQELRFEVEALLSAKLWEVRSRLPAAVVARLQKVPFWVHLNRSGNPGAAYHPSPQWLADHDLDPAMAGGIEIGNAHNFLSWVHVQPSMVLHELAHAFHHQVIGYGHQGLRDAYAQAQQSGRYDDVLYAPGGRQRAYALNNVMEYFAEGSEAYWGVNDFYPFVRAELEEQDPVLYGWMKKVWVMPTDGAAVEEDAQ